MATLLQLPSGNWRVQIRRKGRYVSDSFRRHKDAEEWALDTERRIDRGEAPLSPGKAEPTTFGDLITLHLDDLKEVGRPARRSKAHALEQLRRNLGSVKIRNLDRARLIQFGRDRFKEGAGGVTLGIDFTFIKTIMVDAAAVHGVPLSTEPVLLARTALKRLGLIEKGRERDRRPTPEELSDILDYLDDYDRCTFPMGRLVRFAIGSAMRLDEICNILWQDLDARHRIVIVRDRKDPRHKEGNNQKVPLLDLTGFDAWALLGEQRKATKKSSGRIFPYNGRSVGTAFRRACRMLKIKNLHFHDLRHEGTSRLFEAGLTIERVSLVTGHKDWKMLKRYANLRPENLYASTQLEPTGNAKTR